MFPSRVIWCLSNIDASCPVDFLEELGCQSQLLSQPSAESFCHRSFEPSGCSAATSLQFRQLLRQAIVPLPTHVAILFLFPEVSLRLHFSQPETHSTMVALSFELPVHVGK